MGTLKLGIILSLGICAWPSASVAQNALTNGAPWQAEIYSNFTGWTAAERAEKPAWELAYRCGGSLIADHWVLTAAHCISQEQVDQGYRVRLGARDLALGEGMTFRIDRMVRHAGYDESRHLNDIALVHYVEDDQTEMDAAGRFEPIALNKGDAVGADVAVTVTGWGKTAPGIDGRVSDALQQAELTTIACNSLPDYARLTNGDVLCAGAPGKDSCQGDSGGPLILTEGEPLLVGIVSWGIGCGEPGRPGVYVRIDKQHYGDWIDRAMAADPSVNEVD